MTTKTGTFDLKGNRVNAEQWITDRVNRAAKQQHIAGPYVVVQHAGEEREHQVFDAPRFRDAAEWVHTHYDPDEIETLHVHIMKRLPDGTLTTEF